MMTPLCFVLTEARNVKREPRPSPLGGGIIPHFVKRENCRHNFENQSNPLKDR